MRNILLIALISLSTSFSFSQDSKSVCLKINNVKIDSKNIEVLIELSNDSTIGLTIVKPNIHYSCYSILNICFEDSITKKEMICSPCTDIYDFDNITINYKNGVYLNPHESFRKVLIIDRSYTNFLHSGRMYYLTITYNLDGVNIDTKMDNIYNKNTKSNSVLVMMN